MTVLVTLTVSSFLFGAVVVWPLMLVSVCLPLMLVSFLDYKTSNQYKIILSHDRKCMRIVVRFFFFLVISGSHQWSDWSHISMA